MGFVDRYVKNGSSNFDGYFIKFGTSSNYKKLPSSFITESGIAVNPNQITEKDAWRNASDNALQRKTYTQQKTSFSFTTVDDLSEIAMKYIIHTVMKQGLVMAAQRKYRAVVWNPWDCDYQAAADYYIPDPSFTVKRQDASGILYYESTTFELIQY